MKWFLWHGNVTRALDTIEDIEGELDLLLRGGEREKKLLNQDTQDTFVAPEEIQGSIAVLVRHDSGVRINLRTSALPAGRDYRRHLPLTYPHKNRKSPIS